VRRARSRGSAVSSAPRSGRSRCPGGSPSTASTSTGTTRPDDRARTCASSSRGASASRGAARARPELSAATARGAVGASPTRSPRRSASR